MLKLFEQTTPAAISVGGGEIVSDVNFGNLAAGVERICAAANDKTT